MMHNVVAPTVGESITEVSILKWRKTEGDAVQPGEVLLEIESDKATVEVAAETAGAIHILKPEGERIAVGSVIATIDDAAQGKAAGAPPPKAPAAGATAPSGAVAGGAPSNIPLSPSVRKAVVEHGLDATSIPGTGKAGRITKGDVGEYLARGGAPAAPGVSVPSSAPSPAPRQAPAQAPSQVPPQAKDKPGDRRVPMSRLRARIAERLVAAQRTAAILTTFNECDMSAVMAVRAKYKDAFKAKHGVPLSFMSFFTRAAVEALKTIPGVNASIDGGDLVYHDYQDVGIAVGTEKGLVVPVVRDAGKMGFLEIEKKIAELAEKARVGKLSIPDLTGGTFTISNGGVYGSLMSTPILTPPQSGILGMHKIMERPVAVNGKLEIRPMMYLALSYDHRIVDGKEAVTFLIAIKDHIENPEKLGLEFVGGL